MRRTFQYWRDSTYKVVSEDEVWASIDALPVHSPYRENGKKVLGLAVGEEVTFPSGASYKRLEDDSPRVSAIICGARTKRACKYCGRTPSTRLCDYPVKRRGREGTCDVPMCDRCTTRVGAETDYCQAHAKLMKEPRLGR